MTTSFVEDYLLYLLARASAQASAGFHQILATHNVAVIDWRILATLWGREEVSIGELALVCQSKQPTLTRAVDRLEARHLVKRKVAVDDRRMVLVSLTDKGSKITDILVDEARAHESELMSEYDPEDEKVLKSALRSIIEHTKPVID